MTGPGAVLTEAEYQQVRQALDQSRGLLHDLAQLDESPGRSAAGRLARLVGEARDALRAARGRAEGEAA